MMLSDASHSIVALIAVHLFVAIVVAVLGFGVYAFFSYRITTDPQRIRRRLGGSLARFAQVPPEVLDTQLVAADEGLRFGWWGFAFTFGLALLWLFSSDLGRLLHVWLASAPDFVTGVLDYLPAVFYFLVMSRLHSGSSCVAFNATFLAIFIRPNHAFQRTASDRCAPGDSR